MENAKQKGTLCAVLKKELFLSTHPALYLFALLGLMTLIPSYPTIVGIGYVALAVLQADGVRRSNKDLEFTLLLPVKRSFVVVGKSLFVIAIELLTLVFAAVGAVLAFIISPAGNAVSIDPNFAFFGIALICLGIYNAIYISGFFKTGYKTGLPTLFGTLGFLAFYTVAELVVNLVPTLITTIDGYGANGFIARLIVFIVGLAVYALLTILGIRAGQKNFEKVSL